jgi:hypothetical protein
MTGKTPGVLDTEQLDTSVTAVSENPTLVSSPTITYLPGSTTGTLTYTLSPNQYGTANITVTVQDNGGTDKGGVNTTTETFTVNVLRINKPPTLDQTSDVTVLENGTLAPVTLTGITPGVLDTDQLVTSVTAVSDNPTLVSSPTITYLPGSTTGTLTYTLSPNQYGIAHITVTVQDNGGTANGGVNTTTETFTVNVLRINQPPTLDQPSDVTVLENGTPAPVTLTGITPGVLDTDQLVTSATAVSDNPSLVSSPTITYTPGSTTGTLTYTLAPNQYGTAHITVTVQDNGGTANGGINTTTETFTVNVLRVNQPPTLDQPSDVTLNENDSPSPITLTGITPAVTDTDQTVISVTAVSDNPSLVSSPTITYTPGDTTGTLTYTLAPNQYGTAHITVTVQDNGGTANGGVDTTVETFTVNVIYVNQPPNLNQPKQVNLTENATPVPIPITGITPTESWQQVISVTATTDNPTLMANLSVSYIPGSSTATLNYTIGADQYGLAYVTITVQDNGGTANGGVDTIVKTYTALRVTRVYAPPTLDQPSNVSINKNASPSPITLTGISTGTGNSDLTATVAATSDNTSLIPNPAVSYTSGTTATLTYTITANKVGTANITVTVTDSNSATNTVSKTFQIVVNGPTITTIANQSIAINTATSALSFTVGDNITPLGSLVISATSSNSTLVNATTGIRITGPDPTTGLCSVIVTPVSGKTGSATITLKVTDSAGLTATTAFKVTVS